MTCVKICGITCVEDACIACEAGADIIGLNFYGRSPRAVSIEEAAKIRRQLPATVQVFGVFVNSQPDQIKKVVIAVQLDAVQLHGDEAPAVVSDLARSVPVFKALRVGADLSAGELEKYSDATGFLFDSGDLAPGQYGGSGRLSNWAAAQQSARGHKIILAGGLNPMNVAAAILQVRPYGVDVASGVESAPGTKDPVQLREFIKEVRRADQQLHAPLEKLRAT